MPEPTNPSSGAGATPGTGSPATGTPASPGATPAQAALTLEEALKKIAELELHASNKTEEATRHGAKLTAAEKELAAYKAAEQAARDAQMSELQKAIDWEAVEFDDATGKPTNVEKLLEKLAKNAPELVKPAPGQQQQQGAPPIPGMSPDRAAYGRSSIQPPGGRIPGKIPTLDDYFQGKGRP